MVGPIPLMLRPCFCFTLDLHFTISSGAVSARVCDGRDDFNFEIVNFPFLDDDVPHSVSGAVCVSQNVQFAGASDCVVDFDAICLLIFLSKGYPYHKLCKTFFSKFYSRYCGLVSDSMLGLGLF